ncbi:MAG: hypothetical protein PX481_24940 [Microcystis sp. M53603_WE2]|jgi:hypothetical protein|uniref:hypothetical protein n=1 Tax=unclassified Microcystis TaxID=2643300 RepID=UPI0022CBBBB5|nr:MULTISPECIES: hypothetical protein [unclassified Microcystis]MCE2661873.1 hypothetical protein [Microcystis sp. 53602_E8]MDJ0526320.1 hypothetical protein [Microcystis sp. M53600_WE12]MDJ0564060.1 hypothetical protein [Microcystis sp. M49629_WE12]MCZ8025434.1 hypothetical protein [Microcystis sp. LE19-10.1B]MDJ0541865.1 hypothetical protein [Microcystis sp. M53603_WE2]
MVKKFLKNLFRKLGVEVKRYNLNTSQVALMERLLEYHKIELIFDMGANFRIVLQTDKILLILKEAGGSIPVLQ